ncbi:hypothetical protein [Luteolibacter sp. Populi]|uniref:hypothetical protein n=1 Tax=Luteolibacter sp. Populi TaxID=3230487 RepID=UPI0034671B9B
MKNPFSSWLRLASIGFTGFALSAFAGTTNLPVLNPGFDTATGVLADSWNSNGGSIRGGAEGGFQWTASYFGGTFPTNNTFGTTIEGPIRQDLTGPGSTFVAGATYQLKVDLFGATTYKAGDSRMWSLALTADGLVVAKDQWFSDEFASQSVANGGAIPNDHIITVNSGSTGLTTATLSFTAPPEFAGQTIGIQLGGDASTVYTLASGSPATNDYFGMMDNVALTVTDDLIAAVDYFITDSEFIGQPIALSWRVVNPSVISTLTLDNGSGPVAVTSNTNATTGEGSISVNPTVTTTYTLTANGGSSKQLTISGGTVVNFTSSATLATAGDGYQVTLDWQVYPPGFPVKISDGTTNHDVSADTDESSGIGSRIFTLTNASTFFTLDQNNGSDTATLRVLRATGNTVAFSLNKSEFTTGEVTTANWSGTTGNPDSWVGIYTATAIPETILSLQWNYLNGTKTAGGNHPAGSMNFTLPAGNYYAVLFVDEDYIVEQGPIPFTVVTPPVDIPFQVQSLQRTGNSITLTWGSLAGREYDVYASDTLEGDPETAWDHVGIDIPSTGDGTTTFTEELPAPAPGRRFYRVYDSEVSPQ